MPRLCAGNNQQTHAFNSKFQRLRCALICAVQKKKLKVRPTEVTQASMKEVFEALQKNGKVKSKQLSSAFKHLIKDKQNLEKFKTLAQELFKKAGEGVLRLK